MAEKPTTTIQREVSGVTSDLADAQRTFSSNYGDSVWRLKKALVEQVTITTAAGMVLGSLVGVIVALRRRG